MIEKIAVLAGFAAALAATYVWLVESDADLDSARIVFCLNAAERGDAAAAERTIKKLSPAFTARGLALADAAKTPDRRPARDDPDDTIVARIKYAASKNLRSVSELEADVEKIALLSKRALALIIVGAEDEKRGGKDFSRLVFKAYTYLSSADKIPSEADSLEILKILQKCKDPKMFVEFAKIQPYSNEFAMLIFSAPAANQKIADFYVQNIRDKKFSAENETLRKLMILAIDGVNCKKSDRARFEKNFVYAAIQFKMPWSIKNWNAYKYPLLAYIAKINGDDDKYRFYRDKSVSKEQLRDMAAGLTQYVEMSARIFAATGDFDTAAKLVNMLGGRQRSLVIKRSARFFGDTAKGRAVLEELLK